MFNLRVYREIKKETGRCSGGNTTGGPRLGVCGGSTGYCTPSTANNLDGSMELDTFSIHETLSHPALHSFLHNLYRSKRVLLSIFGQNSDQFVVSKLWV